MAEMRIAVGSDERTKLTDAATSGGARCWNDSNILAMGLRGVSIAVASEILDAWFAGQPDDSERANIELLKGMDCREGELAPFAATAHQIGGVQ